MFCYNVVVRKENENMIRIRKERVLRLGVILTSLLFIGMTSACSKEKEGGNTIFSPISGTIFEGFNGDFPIHLEHQEKIHIYLNPSVQTWNMYANNLGTEAEHMNKIANLMYRELSQYRYIEIEGNFAQKGLSLSQSIQESNSKHRDIHFALHSNAGGGTGTEIYTKNQDAFAIEVYQEFMKDLPFTGRGVKNGQHLYEVNSVRADHVALIEILFHDNVEEATYFVTHHDVIAKKLANAILRYIHLYYK